MKLYRNAKAYKPAAQFKTFLFRVATNHCLNEVRRGEYRVAHTTTSPHRKKKRAEWMWRDRKEIARTKRWPGASWSGPWARRSRG